MHYLELHCHHLQSTLQPYTIGTASSPLSAVSGAVLSRQSPARQLFTRRFTGTRSGRGHAYRNVSKIA